MLPGNKVEPKAQPTFNAFMAYLCPLYLPLIYCYGHAFPQKHDNVKILLLITPQEDLNG
jgi:hypothetical protein